jgi:hypothetical protein
MRVAQTLRCAEQLASFQTEELRQQGRFAGANRQPASCRLQKSRCIAIVAYVLLSISPPAACH